MSDVAQRAGGIAVGLATALVIVTVAIGPFLTPVWVAFEQGRADAMAWTGFTEPDLRAATNAILVDLVLGPPDFDVEVAGAPVLNERERGHMRDVRSVFMALWLAAAISLVVLLVAALRVSPVGRWRSVGRGALTLAIATIGLGLVALVAFETLFDVFHRLVFPAGSYAFDPGTERLVQLFPFQFWQESAVVVGAVIVALATIVTIVARRRGREPG